MYSMDVYSMDEYSIDDNETTKQSERPTRPLYNTDHNNTCAVVVALVVVVGGKQYK